MAANIEAELGAQCPNIVIFDWKDGADILISADQREQMRELIRNNDALLRSVGILSAVKITLTSVSILDFLVDLQAVTGNGRNAIQRLAVWIRQNLVSGNIVGGTPIGCAVDWM